MWLIRRQESIGVISLVFYCLPLLGSPPPSPQLGDINNPLPQHTFHARVSTALAALAWHSHPSLCTPSSYITHHPPASLYFSLPTPPSSCCFSIPCHRLSTWKHLSSSLTASCGRHSERKKKKKQEKTLSGNMQKCEKVDVGCPGNGSEVISKHWWKSMSCARQAGTSVLRKIRKKGGGGKEEKGGLEGQRKMQRNRNQVFLLSEP